MKRRGMTKEKIINTLNGVIDDPIRVWTYIDSRVHPTKTNGEVYGKLQDLRIAVSTSSDCEMCNAFEKFCNLLIGALAKPDKLAVTKEGVKLFNAIRQTLMAPSNP